MAYRIFAAAAALGFCVAGTQAALISFASDTNPFAPTLQGEYDAGLKITSVIDRNPTMVSLLTDPDEDGPMGPITNPVSLVLTFSLDHVSSDEVYTGIFTHTFVVNGSFEFRDSVTGELYYGAEIQPDSALFVGIGTATTIMAAGITGFEALYTVGVLGQAIVGFGGTHLGDFSYTLSAMNNGAGAALVFEGDEVVGINDYIAESSFSGSFIPTPGAVAMGLISGLFAFKRRRIA